MWYLLCWVWLISLNRVTFTAPILPATCSALTQNGLHRLICFNTWSSAGGTVGEGLDVALAEEVCLWGNFRSPCIFSSVSPWPLTSSWLMDQDVSSLGYCSSPTPTCWHASLQNTWNYNPTLNSSFHTLPCSCCLIVAMDKWLKHSICSLFFEDCSD